MASTNSSVSLICSLTRVNLSFSILFIFAFEHEEVCLVLSKKA
jgi:hypothetical protein